ncbi:MAG: hypothetical protein Q7S92_05210 [Candidatus Diapherotrites archaeon]|nr:hypothetical protein [Candidatus Diapherotrites archaeon]
MKNYDSIKNEFSNTRVELSEVLKKVAPEFSELSLDIKDLAKYSSDPLFLSLLMFQLTKEREQSNKILTRIEEKFDQILFFFKTQPHASSTPTHVEENQKEFSLLADQDEKIMGFIEKNGQATADEIMKELDYKNQNGASQRLNMLFKQGLLKKIRAGKKVHFIKSH